MDYKHIYTDGSKDDMKVGCAVVSDDFSETMRIPDGSSIFTAEAKAIDPGESLPPCRGLWGTLHTGDDIDCNYCLLWEC